jgi:sec-independent protein translocase protein TatA
MFNLGPQELLFIFLIVLLLFGGKKIPEIARSLGRAMREFKKGVDHIEDEIARAPADSPDAATAPHAENPQEHAAPSPTESDRKS